MKIKTKTDFILECIYRKEAREEERSAMTHAEAFASAVDLWFRIPDSYPEGRMSLEEFLMTDAEGLEQARNGERFVHETKGDHLFNGSGILDPMEIMYNENKG